MSRFEFGFKVFRWSMAFIALTAVGGCQTTFLGDPHFPGGPHGCFEACAKQSMQMASFVYVGEYSSACACKPLTKTAQPGSESPAASSSEDDQAAVVAAAAGVELQRRRAEEERRRSWQK